MPNMESENINVILAIIYIFIISYAIISDYRTLIIPNWCSIVLIIEFLLFSILFLTMDEFAWHLLAGAIVFVLGIGFYAFGWLGGGDVKLLTAVIFWAGPTNGLIFVLAMAAIGFVMAVGLIILRRVLIFFPNLFPNSELLRRPVAWVEEGAFPYGIAIGAAALIIGPAIFFP